MMVIDPNKGQFWRVFKFYFIIPLCIGNYHDTETDKLVLDR